MKKMKKTKRMKVREVTVAAAAAIAIGGPGSVSATPPIEADKTFGSVFGDQKLMVAQAKKKATSKKKATKKKVAR